MVKGRWFLQREDGIIFTYTAFAAIAALLYVFCLSVFVQSYGSMTVPSYVTLLAVILAVYLLAGLKTHMNIIYELKRDTFIFIMLVLTMALRLVWVLTVNTDVFSDFYLYHAYALKAAKGVFNNYDPTYSLFPFKFGYPLVLSLVYRISGGSILAAKLFNVFISMCLMPVVYHLALKAFDGNAARTSVMLYAFWPSQIMYTSVLGSELLFTLLFCISAAFFMESLVHTGMKSYLYFSAFGAAAAFSGFIRPVAVILILAATIYLLFLHTHESFHPSIPQRLASKFGMPAAAILGFLVVSILQNQIQYNLTGVSPWRSSSGFNLMVGTNRESSGKYSTADEQLVEGYKNDFARFHQVSWKIAIERIKSDPLGFVRLIEEKMVVQWTNEDYGYYWSTLKLEKVNGASSFLLGNPKKIQYISFLYYVVLVSLALSGCIHIYRNRLLPPAIFLLVLEGFLVAHVFLEVQSRYHYPVMPFIIILAGCGLNRVSYLLSVKPAV